MEISKVLAILWRRKWVIVITFVVTVAVVALGLALTVPKYVATTTLRVSVRDTQGYTDSSYMDRLLNTYTIVATSAPVLNELRQRVGFTTIPKISVELVSDTELINISAAHPDPQTAKAVVNTMAEILTERGRTLIAGISGNPSVYINQQLKQQEGELNRLKAEYQVLASAVPSDTEKVAAKKQQVDLVQGTYQALLDQYEQARVREAINAGAISVVEPAATPVVPSDPDVVLYLLLGGLVGLMGGVALALVLQAVDRDLYSSKEIEAASEYPVVARIPQAAKTQLFPPGSEYTPLGEACRWLRGNLFSLLGPDGPKLLQVTSARLADGKTVVSANMAFSLAQVGKRVLLIDGDLRSPAIHTAFGLSNNLGLSTILDQEAEVDSVVLGTQVTGLFVLPSGPMPTNPAELLAKPGLKTLLRVLKEKYDYIVIDTPDLLPVTDASLVAQLVDLILVVVKRTRISQDELDQVSRTLHDHHVTGVGLVINYAEGVSGSKYYLRKQATLAQKLKAQPPEQSQSAMQGSNQN
jgi:capsular exopolysaccharide synthesis family protein